MVDLMIGLILVGAVTWAFVGPRKWLLPSALVMLAVYPRKFSGAEGILEFVAIPLVLIVAWFLRGGTERLAANWSTASTGKAAAQRLALLLGCWCFLLSLVSVALVTSLQWTAALIISITMLCLAPPDPDEVTRIKGTWVVVGALSGLYCFLEFALQMNPVYDLLYEMVGANPVQHWSVYRPSAGFGHPLYAGLFLSMASALALGEAVSGRKHRLAYAAAAVVCALATALTASRSALGALAVAAGMVLVLSIVGRGKLSPLTKTVFSGTVVVFMWAAYQLPSLQERLESEEAESSWEARAVLLRISLATADERWYLGSGPGSSAIAIERHNPQDYLLESSLLQLLVSLGILGLALFLLLIAVSFFRAARRGELGLVGLLVAFCVSTFSFNALDSNRVYLVPLGLALCMIWGVPRRRPHPSRSRTRRVDGIDIRDGSWTVRQPGGIQ